MATVAVAAISVVAAQRLERMASLSILVSAGILLSAVGFAQPSLTAGALFYLVSSTLALSALFLLAELIERSRSANDIALDEDADQLPKALESLHPVPGTNLDDEQKAVVGHVIPWTMAFLGLSFIACALLIIGMPPLSGFLGKLTLISALLTNAILFTLSVFTLAMVLTLIRLFKGPSAQDRVLALDYLYILAMLMMLVLGIRYASDTYFEAALLIALFGFVGSFALAKFLLRGEVIE